MNFKGVKVKGLSFFPRLEKVFQPSFHKYGSVATWSQNTDQIKAGYQQKEIAAFKHNMAVTGLINPFTEYVDAKEIYNSGRVGMGIYFPTDRWRDPNVLESEPDFKIKYSLIPDFYETVWSQKAVDAGLITADLIGTAKPADYPKHGQELFNQSNGKYGYDLINNVAGQIDTFSPLIEFIADWFYSMFGRYPSSASYGYGRTTGAYLMQNYFIGTRNSQTNYTHEYVFSKGVASSIPSTTRQNDMTWMLNKTSAEVRLLCEGYLQEAINNGGWYRDFTHWHSSTGDETPLYYESQRAIIGVNDVVTLDFGSALEYQALRDMVRRTGLYTVGNDLVLITDIKDNQNLPKNRIETSLSVEINLTGTVLEGKEIEGIGSTGIRKKSANVFIVEIPYSKRDGFATITLKETLTPNYNDFSLPTFNSVSKNGNTLTVITDKPTNIVIYSTPTGSPYFEATVLKRSSIMSKNHYVDVTGINFTNKDIYIAAITNEKQSTLSAAYNF
jgi:hypothetical protein